MTHMSNGTYAALILFVAMVLAVAVGLPTADGSLASSGALSGGDAGENSFAAPALDEPSVPSEHASGSIGYGNPAALYCHKLGYQYEIREDEEGNQYGVCVFPDGSECNAWDFFRGECGGEYSYCARNGYDIETEVVDRGGYITECAVCVSRARDGTDATRVPVLELMQRNGEPLIETISCKADEDSRDDYLQSYSTINISERGDLPSEFDWRDVGGHSYIGPVRNQGSCGSCYAFGACAAAESVYNIANGLTDGSCSDLSESFIMWCLGGLSEYTPHFYGCDGSDYYYMELTALTDEGVCSESDFPYQTWDPGSCTHWDDPRTVFSSWSRISCNDVDAIKTAILNYGVVDVAVMTSYNFDTYNGGIYSDSMTTCYGSPCWMTPTDHIVSLVGWGHDAVEGDYWILRNSWGDGWGEGGYMRIAVTSARVACEATYITGVLSPTPTPTPTPEAEIEIALKAGWNMVSVPVIPLDNSVGAVFPGVAVVYSWDPVNKCYTVPPTIEPEKGYMVAVTGDMTIVISGEPVTTWTGDVTAGWGMIGSLFSDASIVDPDDDPDGSVEAFAYWWDPISRSFVYTTDIEPGKGYMVASTQDCALTMSSL